MIDITKEQLAILNSFCGTGDFLNADIIFFGNEEGLGGDNLEKVLSERIGESKRNNCIIPNKPLNGHYRTTWAVEKETARSQMLQFQVRLLLFLNNPKENWFALKEEAPLIFEQIKEYQRVNLYRENNNYNLKSALVDLRPLPRYNETEWPFKNLDRQQYISAFKFTKRAKVDKLYSDLKEERIKIIQNLFHACHNVKVIVGIGDKDSKKRFFEVLFVEIVFETIWLSDKTCFHATIDLNGKLVHIFLSNFFDYRAFGLNNLENLARKIEVNNYQ